MAGQGTTRFWIALVAAYVLVLNAGIGAYATGAGHASTSLDAFGNPLCIGQHAIEIGDDGPPEHRTPACCVLGCTNTGWAPPPDTTDSDAIRFSVIGASPDSVRGHHRDGPGRYDPGRPRAPPDPFC